MYSKYSIYKIVFSVLLLLFINRISWAKELSVSSHSFENGKPMSNKLVFNNFGCQGENKSPHVKWSPGPEGTKYYAVTMYDPDAPTGSGWWHWTLVNIPLSTTELPEGLSGSSSNVHSDQWPKGSFEGQTDFGKPGYGGPCPPPHSPHHKYVITVYALKDKVPVDSKATGAMVGFYLNSLKNSQGSITGLYKR